jgi:hypothetical protein
MQIQRCSLLGACVLVLLAASSGGASAARGYPDRAGDVTGGAGPDMTSVNVSNTATVVTFRVRFARQPPLGVSTSKGWADMLLIALDVPPFGPRPVAPGGEWAGANFAFGTHGPSKTGLMVKLGAGFPQASRKVATFTITTTGSTLVFSIPRRPLGKAASFTFMVAAAREMLNGPSGGGIDVAPANGTFRYTLTG